MAAMDQSTRTYLQRIGKRGGQRRAAVLTEEERRAIARQGGVARWANSKRPRKGKA